MNCQGHHERQGIGAAQRRTAREAGLPWRSLGVSAWNPGHLLRWGLSIAVLSLVLSPLALVVVPAQLAGATSATPGALVAPAFTADTPPSTATVGAPYSYTYAASGNPAPGFGGASGALPTGLNLNATTGVVSGTPIVAGVFTFTVAATNGVAPNAISPATTITVMGAPTFSAATPPATATVGAPYFYKFLATGPPAPTFALASGALPTGLTLNATTGVLSGRPTAAGPFTFRVKATNGVSPEALSGPITITVNASSGGDFDGDGITDLAVFRPSAGVWYIELSGGGTKAINWGINGDIPVPGDFNGDGVTDIAVFRPSAGMWFIQLSGGGTKAINWGVNGDIPVAGDYNGDGITDVAVFRPSAGTWYIQFSGGGGSSVTTLGGLGDVPVPGDYNGDGKTDVAVFHPGTGIWTIHPSGGNGDTVTTWGGSGDIPVPGDYNGDGKTDFTVFNSSTGVWSLLLSGGGGTEFVSWGASGDIPLTGDYTGDGKTDIAVFRPSSAIWFVHVDRGGTNWGIFGDRPIEQAPGVQ